MNTTFNKFLLSHSLAELNPLHGFVNKSGREILQNNSRQGLKAIAFELFFVFHAQIFHKIRAQLMFLG
jgi:hypothetical protein